MGCLLRSSKEPRNMRRFHCGFVWDWGWHVYEDYYDGPFWNLHILNFWAVWNWDGLPYIFWD